MRSFVSVASLALYAVFTPAPAQTGDMILRPHDKDAVALTPDQQAVLDKIVWHPEAVNVRVLKMPDAAHAEHTLTGPEDRFAKVVLPFGEGKDITLVRSDLRTRQMAALPGEAWSRRRASLRRSCCGKTAIYQGIWLQWPYLRDQQPGRRHPHAG